MKALCLALLLAAAPLCAADARWQQVLVFDWLYPGEPTYEALKQAAAETGSKDWLVACMQRNEKIPQASARELANELAGDPGVTPEVLDQLNCLILDEPALLDEKSNGSVPKHAAELAAELDSLGKRMDDIDTIFNTNRYGKGSLLSVNMDMYSAYRLDAPAGMVQVDNAGYMFGGMRLSLSGTIGQVNYIVKLSEEYENFNSVTLAPEPLSTLNGDFGAGVGFLVPLSSGGLEVHMGDDVSVALSPLLFSSVKLPNHDEFFVDVSDPFRPKKLVNDLDLNYPYDTVDVRGLYIKKEGADRYFPFSKFQALYYPDLNFWRGFGFYANTLAMRADDDLGVLGDRIDKLLFYAVYVNAQNDADQLRGAAVSGQIPQVTSNYSLGSELTLSQGTSLKVEGALSHYTGTLTYTAYTFDDSAWLASLIQPLGRFNVALEAGMAGPRFLTKPRDLQNANNGDTLGRDQTGATLDTIFNGTPWPNTPAPPNDLSWISVMKDPSVQTNNSQRVALKTEWHGSFLSLGLYDGAATQIVATGPYVMTTPYIEGNPDDGYGWFRIFGAAYSLPPAPFSTPALSAGNQGQYYQAAYNRPTDGQAIYDNAGHTAPVHWQEISQQSYRESDFTLLLSDKGNGDAQIMADSVKTTNYAGATMHLDFKPLLDRVLPFGIVFTGEVRDLAAQVGVPAFDGSNLFNQQIGAASMTYGLTPLLNLLAMGAYETWKSDHSYYPLDIQTTEAGVGADWKLDPLLSTLQFNLRATLMQHQDLNESSRQFSLTTVSVGSTLSY